jgi:hypothetical protein
MLFSVASGEYYSLNEVGTRVWDLADGSHTPEDLARILEREYEAEYLAILEDVRSLVREMTAEGLLVDLAE